MVQRKRAVFYNALGYAVERELLEYNPIDKVQWRAPAVAEAVDRRVVASTEQVEAILRVVPDVHRNGGHLVAFFGCLYYVGMRPSEVANLHLAECELPERGWGRIVLAETAPHAGADWTDNGKDASDQRTQAPGCDRGTTGPDPARAREAPPASRRRVRRSGGRAAVSLCARWSRTRIVLRQGVAGCAGEGVHPEQVASPLAGRPYDLRHAALSLWLNGGVPATEVARRAGQGVAVLLKVYAGCIDGEEEQMNKRIERALRGGRGRRRS
jgi:integrase